MNDEVNLIDCNVYQVGRSAVTCLCKRCLLVNAFASSENGSPTLAAPAEADAPLEGSGHRTFFK